MMPFGNFYILIYGNGSASHIIHCPDHPRFVVFIFVHISSSSILLTTPCSCIYSYIPIHTYIHISSITIYYITVTSMWTPTPKISTRTLLCTPRIQHRNRLYQRWWLCKKKTYINIQSRWIRFRITRESITYAMVARCRGVLSSTTT